MNKTQSITELQQNGFEVISPGKTPTMIDDWERVIKNLELIKKQNVIVLMPNWETNSRSMFEVFYAVNTGKILIDVTTQQEIQISFSRIYFDHKTKKNEKKGILRLLSGRSKRPSKIHKNRSKNLRGTAKQSR